MKAKKRAGEIERNEKRRVQGETQSERGDPFREMLRTEEEEDVSVIVIGPRGKAESYSKIFSGSVFIQSCAKSKQTGNW